MPAALVLPFFRVVNEVVCERLATLNPCGGQLKTDSQTSPMRLPQ